VIVNKAAFDALDKPTQAVVLKAAADAETAAGRSAGEDRRVHRAAEEEGMTVAPPTVRSSRPT
jgi:TRAP-type C4-dicarboxylate transport system substrate-binding protein